MAKRRVVVTGLGMLSPLGNDVKSSWQACKEGRSGIVFDPKLAEAGIPSQIIGRVKDFDSSELISQKEKRRLDIFSQAGLYVADEAIKDSGIEVTEQNAVRIGVAVGSGIGGIDTITTVHKKFIEFGHKKVSPFFIPAAIINMVAGNISIRYGLKGPNISIVTACTTGTHNIGQAFRMIQYGDADVMIAGGSEMSSIDVCVSGFAAAKALSTNFNDRPQQASRPWDKDRDGFVSAEGAGVVVLEEYEHAKKRGANIYAEAIGFGMSADAYHMTQPSGDGGVNSMNAAIKDAGISADSIAHVNAHATSTPLGDIVEIDAIKRVLGSHANNIPISGTKSMTGHLTGASGAVEAIFSVLSIRDGVAPPTINLDNPSEGCDLNLVPHTAQEHDINVVLSNSFGFGGTNATIIFSKIS